NLAYAAKQLGHSVEMLCSTYSGLLEERGRHRSHGCILAARTLVCSARNRTTRSGSATRLRGKDSNLDYLIQRSPNGLGRTRSRWTEWLICWTLTPSGPTRLRRFSVELVAPVLRPP